MQRNLSENTLKEMRNAFFEDHHFIFYSCGLRFAL
jgi:hypothetical protein